MKDTDQHGVEGILKLPQAVTIRSTSDHGSQLTFWCRFYRGREIGEPGGKTLEAQERPSTNLLTSSSHVVTYPAITPSDLQLFYQTLGRTLSNIVLF